MSVPNHTRSAPFNLRLGAISAGDIVFVYNERARGLGKVKEFINVNGQRVLASVRKRDRLSLKLGTPKYSHVMLGMDGGLIIHADGKTVTPEVISDALRFQTNEALRFQVYRRKDITKDIADKIVESAMRYYSQKYQFLTYFAKVREGDTTQFCSKLIASAYCSAGVPLASRPDNKVLPLDLYQICQSDDWREVTAEFIEEPLPPGIDEMFSPIMVPGKGEMSLSDFLADADALYLKLARRDKQWADLRYRSTQNALDVVAHLGKRSSLLLKLAKLIYRRPSKLKDGAATRIIIRILEQLQALLDYSQLPNIELLIDKSFLNTVEEGQTNIGLYVRNPPPLAIREMQKATEVITIYSYLIFAEIGLCTILAHYTPREEFKRFRVVKNEYAKQFFAALPPVIDLLPYENEQELFKWVEVESDRATSQRVFHNIIAALKIIKILRNADSKSN